MNHYAYLQTRGKRFLAGFLDVVFVFLVSLSFYIAGTYIAYREDSRLTEVNILLVTTSIYSELYIYNNETERVEPVKNSEDFPKALYHFYVDKHVYVDGIKTDDLQRGFSPLLVQGHEFNTAEDYYTVILGKGSEDTLFNFNTAPEDPWDIPAKSGQNNAVEAFYDAQFATAINELDAHPEVQALMRESLYLSFLLIGASYVAGALIMIGLIPMFRKDQATFGKVITKTIILNKLGFKMTKLQGNMRNLALFLFSYVFFFVPFHIVSYFLMYFDEEQRSFFDRLTATKVCDKKNTLIFDDVVAETKYRKALAQRLIAVENRKAENRGEKPILSDHVNHND